MKVRGYFTNLGNAVAATSYALMLHLEHNDWEGATAIMKWLQTQRNSMVRWSGTQVSHYGTMILDTKLVPPESNVFEL